uniref:FBA_2 domain-containing protein n=1 Tax=Caenorhabditis tropicalis TaxID=1561998 RepID=A0A1I7TAB1_9PELO
MEFSLIRLPDVPKIQIIQLMTIGERIKLVISSRRMENYLSRVFKKPNTNSDYNMNLKGKFSFISIGDDEWRVFMGPSKMEYSKPDNISEEDVKPWINEKCTVIENTLNVFVRLQNVFPCGTTNLCVDLNKIDPMPIPNILSYPCVANLTGIHFYGGTVQKYELDAIMEWRKENTIQFITISDNKIPLDYRHPNALRFSGVMYNDARWVRIEDLLSMRNVIRSFFVDNNFSMQDLNTFIKYWTNCDENMFTYLYIGYKSLDMLELMKDITVLKGFRSKKSFYLIASNTTENQLLMTVGLVSYPAEPGRRELEFYVLSANTPHHVQGGSTEPAWTREYRILRRLARKRWLDEKRVTVEEAKELDDLEKELAAEGVRMIDGIMTVEQKL